MVFVVTEIDVVLYLLPFSMMLTAADGNTQPRQFFFPGREITIGFLLTMTIEKSGFLDGMMIHLSLPLSLSVCFSLCLCIYLCVYICMYIQRLPLCLSGPFSIITVLKS